MSRLALALPLFCARATAAPPPAAPRARPTLRELASRMEVQLRRGPGIPPCKALGAGLEVCPVLEERGGAHFLTAEELAAMAPPGDEGPPPAEHAYMIGLLSLMATLGQAELTWVGDAEEPHRVAVMTRPGAEEFDAARLLALPSRIDELVDDLGLQFLAAVPDTRTLVLWKDEDHKALAMAHELVAERGRLRPANLAPETVFVVTPEGFEASTWAR